MGVQTVKMRPNVVVFFTDQQRWDTVGAYGNPMHLTPCLDALAARGVRFEHAFTPQPVCAPARAALQTGRYATATGVWKNYAAPLRQPTLATAFRAAGYETAYIGKWHLACTREQPVPPDLRGDYEFWEAADALEHTSGPFGGHIFDGDGKPLTFQGYRTDFLTERAERFIYQLHQRPFLLFLSFLEPHHQNDQGAYVAPRGYAERFADPYVPPDLAPLPGDWGRHLPHYYGQVARLDEMLGRVLQALRQAGVEDNTIVVFTSDHGNHFRTRNAEYKRSCHEASIRVPLVIAGPGVARGRVISSLVSLVDVAPTLWDVAGVPGLPDVHGHSTRPLWEDSPAWPDRVFIQISGSEVGRALRTARYKYGVVDPDQDGRQVSSSTRYVERYFYDLIDDPAEQVNLVGQKSYQTLLAQLRGALLEEMRRVGEAPAQIRPFAAMDD